jgi:hypothetical protein
MGARLVVFLLALFLVIGTLWAVATVKPERGNQSKPQSKPSKEEIEKAEMERRRAEEERQQEIVRQAEREREEERQRQADRQQQLERLKEAARQKNRKVTSACVSRVRDRSNAGMYKSFSRFDAYVTGEYGESFSYFGTAEERFQFEKCLAEQGIQLTTGAEGSKK